MIGGLGNDTYLIGIADTIVEQPDEGIDTVLTSSNYALDDNVENLTFRGTASINGSAMPDNMLTGNNAANVLTGGTGNDKLYGGAGDDTYVFNLGDGTNSIEDLSLIDEGNRIRFGSGITQADLTFSQSQDILTIQSWSRRRCHSVDKLRFIGNRWIVGYEDSRICRRNTTDLSSLLVSAATEGDDVLAFGSGNDVV